MPLIMGPSVCPMSRVVFKKPIDVPSRLGGVSSHISGDVEEITMVKPMLYPMESMSNNGNSVVNGIRKRVDALIVQPMIMGRRLLYLSDNLPSIGRNMIKKMTCMPIIVEIDSALRFAISIMY